MSSKIVESLYRISGISLNENQNQIKVKNIYQKLPNDIKLADGTIFQSTNGLNGEYAFKEVYIPFVDYKDAVDYCEQNKIPKDVIFEEDNGDVYVIKTEKYQCWLKGHFYDYEVNQYEGKSIKNTFDYFPVKMEDIFIPIYNDEGLIQESEQNKLMLDIAKKANSYRAWPSNAGITYKKMLDKSQYELIKVK